jgi:hypothetical protein
MFRVINTLVELSCCGNLFQGHYVNLPIDLT